MAITLSGDGIARANLAADVIDSTKLADDAVDTEHLADDAVDSAEIAAGAIDAAHMSANSIDSDSYVDGSIDTAHIANDQITNALMADDAVGVAQLSATGTASSSTFLRGDNAWAAAGGGKVLQVVNTVYCSESTSTSSSYADLGMSATMTCASSSNKILVIVDLQGIRHYGGDTSLNAYLQKDSSNWKLMGIRISNMDTGTPAALSVGGTGGSFLDAVGDTSAHTYKIVFANRAGTGSVRINDDNACSSITLMEIEG